MGQREVCQGQPGQPEGAGVLGIQDHGQDQQAGQQVQEQDLCVWAEQSPPQLVHEQQLDGQQQQLVVEVGTK